MKPYDIDVAIAKSLGYKYRHSRLVNGNMWHDSGENICDLPSFHDDLNNLRDAVMSLSTQDKVSYVNFWLPRVVESTFLCDLIVATPKQVAEAYLKTIKKWVD